jgi:hypothetical protein
MNAAHRKDSAPVPDAVSQTLRGLVTRLRRVILLRGVLGVAAVLVVTLLVVMGMDAWLAPVSAWPRWAATLTALALTAGSAWWFLLRPLAHSFTLTGVARMLEVRHPELQERLSSALELLMSDDAPEVRGSETLIAALARQADADARAVRPRREFTHRRSRPMLAASLGGALILGVLVLAWPHESLRLLARAVAPFANLPNVQADQLHLDPGEDTIVVEGARLRVSVDAPPSARFAELRVVSSGGEEIVHAMTPVEAGGASGRRSYTAFSDPARKDFRYRVRAGDALTRYFQVTVVPRPEIDSIYLTYDYPDYTGLESRSEPEATGDISALAGTDVGVKVFTTSPVTDAEVLLGESPVEVTLREIPATGGSCCEFALPLVGEVGPVWSIRLHRVLGGKQFSSEPAVFAVEALGDSRPEVRAAVGGSRAEAFTLNRKDRPELVWQASDDFGVASAELRVEVDGRKLAPIPLEIQTSAAELGFVGRTRLDLPELGAATAGSLRVQVAAIDNRPERLGGPQIGLSRPFRVHFDDQASYLHVQVRLDDESLIRETLEGVLRELRDAKDNSHALRKSQARRGPLTGQDIERVDRIREKLAGVQVSLGGLIDEISTGVYASLTDRLGEVVEHGVRARSLAGEIKITDVAESRAGLADETDFEIGRAVSLVSRMLEQFNVLTDVVLRAAELTEMSDEQEVLADLARDLAKQAEAPPQAMTPEQWQAAQDALAKRMGEMLSRTPSAMDAMTRRDAERSESLTARAARLARQQERLREQTEALAQIEKELGELAQEQRNLADRTRKTEPIEKLSHPMDEAAKRLDEVALDGAIEWQKTAEEGIAKRREELERESAASYAAIKASEIAHRQRELAKRATGAADQRERAEAEGKSAGEAASRAEKEARTRREELSPELEQLAGRQDELAKRASRLERTVETDAMTAEAKGITPSETMEATAKEVRDGAVDRAERSANEAAKQADQLAGKLGKIADSLPEAEHLKRAVDAARRDVTQAHNAASLAHQAAASADQRAREVAQGGESPEATEARERADRMLQVAENADRKHAESRGILATLEERKREQEAKSAATAKRMRDQAKDIAADQRALASDIAKLAKGRAKGLIDARSAQRTALEQQATQRQLARKATDSLGELGEQQKQQIEALGEVRRSLAKATGDAKQAGENRDPSEAMRRASEALGKQEAPQAGRHALDAAREAKELADALESVRAKMGGENPKSPGWLRRQADKASEAGRVQEELRRRTEDLASRRRSLIESELARVRHEQGELAEEAGQLATEVSRVVPQKDRLQTRAAQSASDASEALKRPAGEGLRDAARDASAAHQQLAELGDRMQSPGEASEPDPDSAQSTSLEDTPARRRELGSRAGELARRQSRLAEQIDALARQEPGGMLAARQDQVAEQTAAVAEDAELIREHMADLGMGEEDASLASQAASSAQEARNSAAEAAKRMPADLPGAQGPQSQAAKAMGRTAERLADLGRRLAARPAQTPEPVEIANPAEMAGAYEAAAQAAAGAEPADAALASELLSGVSQAAVAMARSMGADMSLLSLGELPPWMSAEDGKGVGLIWISRALAEIHELGISTDEWARLPGELRSEILQAAETEGPEEYRAYIREYFRELARRAAAPKAETSPESKP